MSARPALRRGWRRAAVLLLPLLGLLLTEPAVRCGYALLLTEPRMLVYPHDLHPDTNLLNINWNPQRVRRGDHSVTVHRTWQGLHFFRLSVNQAGFRLEDPRLAKDTFNVVCLGGSSTFGHNSDGKTFPELLQQQLARMKGARVKVYNLGVRGAASSEYRAELKQLRNLARVDLLVFYSGHNDADHSRALGSDGEIFSLFEGSPGVGYSLLLRNLYIVARAGQFKAIQDRVLNAQIKIEHDRGAAASAALQRHIRQTIALTRQHNPKVKAVVVSGLTNYRQPLYQAARKYKLASFHQRRSGPAHEVVNYYLLLNAAALKELPREDPAVSYLGPELFASHPVGRMMIDTVHLSDAGNAVLAAALARHIAARGLR